MSLAKVLLFVFTGNVWGWISNVLIDLASYWGGVDSSSIKCSSCGSMRSWSSVIFYPVSCTCLQRYPQTIRRWITHGAGVVTGCLVLLLPYNNDAIRLLVMLICAVLYVMGMIDMEHRIALVGYLSVTGALFAATGIYTVGLQQSVIGGVIGVFPLIVVSLLSYGMSRLLGGNTSFGELLGAGDYIFVIFLGMLFGVSMVRVWVWVALTSLVISLLVTMISKITKQKVNSIPFITVLSLASFVVLFIP